MNKLKMQLTGTVILLILVGTLVGCVPGAQAVQTEGADPAVYGPTSDTTSPGSLDELVEALKGAGAGVEATETIEQVFFSAAGKKLVVNGAEIQVFEYAYESARKADSDQISKDGSSIGTSMVTWIDQPNFWVSGRVIVLYIGQDEATISMLSSVLGEPITQPG